MPLTDKQQAFAVNKAHGMKNRDAVIAAGYAPTAADVTGSQLMKRPDIKKAIAAAKKQQTKSSPAAGKSDNEPLDDTILRTNYTDPLQFFMEGVNNARLPLGLRFEAAKQALPYMHGRVGEKGKKEKKQDDAGEVAGRGKFSPKAPPKLHAVK